MIQYSQRDTRWASDILGFSEDDVTIGEYGCLLTSCATILKNHGFDVDPKKLNRLLQEKNGYAGAYMYIQVLSSLFPISVNVSDVNGSNAEAMLKYIDDELEASRPVIVELDFSPNPGYQNHWVVLTKKSNGTYYISDPWSMNPEKETVTLAYRYGFGGETKKIISKVFSIMPYAEASNELLDDELSTNDGTRIETIVSNLRLRSAPSINSQELVQLPLGTTLTIGGNQITDGQIIWQPVLVYVAAKQENQFYVKKKN